MREGHEINSPSELPWTIYVVLAPGFTLTIVLDCVILCRLIPQMLAKQGEWRNRRPPRIPAGYQGRYRRKTTKNRNGRETIFYSRSRTKHESLEDRGILSVSSRFNNTVSIRASRCKRSVMRVQIWRSVASQIFIAVDFKYFDAEEQGQ